MLDLLIPLSAFFPLAAMYLGGSTVDLAPAPAWRQVVGLLLWMVLFTAAWWVARLLVASLMGMGVAAGMVALLPAGALVGVLARLAFRMVGSRIEGTLSLMPYAGHAH